MRAVNLIPAEDRRPGTAGAGRSGGMVYVLLGALFIGLVMVVALTVVNRSLGDRRADLADVKAQADAAQAKAAALAPYTQFAALRAKRVETVKSLAASRFDWSHAMHEVSRVIPENVWLQSLKGSVSSASGGGGGLRSSLPAPAIEIAGCTTSQKSVARMMSRMRLVDGVQRVSLDSSAKGGGGGAAGGGGGCGASDQFPAFQMVVFFAAPKTPAAAAPAAAAPVPSTASGSTP
jgi:Tfp pilus assembly protein PilN